MRRTDGGLRAEHDRRPHLPVVAVHERLGERADDGGHAHPGLAPVAVVPPRDVAGTQPVVGGAAVGLDAVDEVEPVVPRRDRAGEPVDGLDEAAAVARRDLRRALERLQHRLVRRHRAHEQHRLPLVTRHPERRGAVARAAAAAARKERGCGDGDETGSDHGRRFERTAPGAVAQTSPCGFVTQMRPAAAASVLLPAWKTSPAGTFAAPVSSWPGGGVAVLRRRLQDERRRAAGRRRRSRSTTRRRHRPSAAPGRRRRAARCR